jgi:glycosyltransferase involved in cell wall biosynthesis
MRCGIGDYTASLAEALGKLYDTKVAVLTETKARIDSSHLNFELFPVAHGWKFSDLPQILKVIRHWVPDVVHIQYPTQGYSDKWLPWLLPIILASRGIPLVQTWHEYLPMGRIRSLPLAIAPSCIIVVRPNYKMVIPSAYRWLIRNKQFQFIPNASAIPCADVTETERAEIRSRFTVGSNGLVSYFGFMYPHKGVELLFEITDPDKHHILLIGEVDPGDSYHQMILERAGRQPWKDNVTVTGFVPPQEVSRLLAASDAVIFPFRSGGGSWNTSVHAATAQGTFVLIASDQKHGYSVSENVYYARPNDVADMREALAKHIGSRKSLNYTDQMVGWDDIATAHMAVYRAVVNHCRG